MITLSDQLKIALPIPVDSRYSNLSLSGGLIKIETIEEYLSRVNINDRYIGLEVLIFSPYGNYQANNFVVHMQLGNFSCAKYKFVNVSNEGLVLVYDSVVIINDLVTGGVSEALSAEMGVTLKTLINQKSFLNLPDTPNNYIGQKDKTIRVKEDETGIEFIERTYLYDQGIPSEVWNITHNLDKYPSVIIKTSAGDTVEGSINYINKNSITIIFNSPFSGMALLN